MRGIAGIDGWLAYFAPRTISALRAAVGSTTQHSRLIMEIVDKDAFSVLDEIPITVTVKQVTVQPVVGFLGSTSRKLG